MNFKILIIGLCLLVCSVSAQTYTYAVHGEHQCIEVGLSDDGNGYATDGVKTATFAWSHGTGNQYYAKYWWVEVPFTITNNELRSDWFPNDVGVLVKN